MLSEDMIEKQSNLQEKESQEIDSDEQQLKQLGYKPQLHRSFGAIESFIASFGAVNFIFCVRLVFSLGIIAGGPLAMWTSFLVNSAFILISCAILCEICSALPISGSVYIWAAVAAGTKYGRFVGFIVAWWVAATWISFTAVCCQGVANYILSLIVVYRVDFPSGVSNNNIKWRALVWIVSEGCLGVCFAFSFIPRRWGIAVIRMTPILMLLDFALCVIWLPIGASKNYGLRSTREALLSTNNATGASPGLNWILSFFFTTSTLVGFDAAGHVAEETKDASTVAARNIFTSAVASVVGGFITTIVFLFCTPNIEELLSLNAPQPFVLIYGMALGRVGSIVMTALASIEGIFMIYIITLAASRIIFAISRDGTLPFSGWVGRINAQGRPQNAMTIVFGCVALLLCLILPSAAAFTSLMSVGVVPTIAAYGLISVLRLFATPKGFKNTKFPLGRAKMIFYACSAIFNGFLVAVLVSPFSFPVTLVNFNFGGIIFGAITLIGALSFWLTPEDKWLPTERIKEMYHGANIVAVTGLGAT